jgi:hypothetical protein
MRKSFDGLTGIFQNELKANPLSAAIFIMNFPPAVMDNSPLP